MKYINTYGRRSARINFKSQMGRDTAVTPLTTRRVNKISSPLLGDSNVSDIARILFEAVMCGAKNVSLVILLRFKRGGYAVHYPRLVSLLVRVVNCFVNWFTQVNRYGLSKCFVVGGKCVLSRRRS